MAAGSDSGTVFRDASSTLDRMKVLVTNDDGVGSPGLHALVRALADADAGYDLLVVAPSSDMSGSSASIGGLHLDQHIDAQPVDLPGAEEVPAFAVAGPPGLCVLASRLGGFGDPPELVVSGINPGGNTGRAVLHSGTVGAALTAGNFGSRGLAVSLDGSMRRSLGRDGDSPHWVTAATIAAQAVPWLVASEPGTVVNINVPDLPLDELQGARWANLAKLGTFRSAVVEPATDGGRLQLELRPSHADLPPDSDTALVQAGYVAVTTITGIQATAPVDIEPIVGGALRPAATEPEDRRTA